MEALDVHVRSRHHTCRYCRVPFLTVQQLSAHKKAAHHICKYCQKDFPSEEACKQHMQERHRCAVCSKHFPQTGDLRTHYMRVHPGHQPHRCPVPSKYSLPGEKAKLCGMSFALQVDLNKHIREEHPGWQVAPTRDDNGCEPLGEDAALPRLDMRPTGERIERLMQQEANWLQDRNETTAEG